MTRTFALTFIFVYLAAAVAFAANKCADLGERLEPKTILTESRVSVREAYDYQAPSRLVIREKALDTNSNRATSELLKMLVQTKSYILDDKSVLNKDELILGIRLQNDYTLQVKYTSNSQNKSLFRVESIETVSPTGRTVKVLKDILNRDRFEIEKSEADIDIAGFPEGLRIEADIPLVITGEPLKKLNSLAEDMKLFTKEDLRQLSEIKSMPVLIWKFKFKKVMALAKKYFIASPFKVLPHAALITPITLLLASALNFTEVKTPHHEHVKTSWIESSINQVSAQAVAPEVRIQFEALKAEAEQRLSENAPSSAADLGPSSLAAPKYSFSKGHMTWVFEKKIEGTNQVKTYIAFTEETNPDGTGAFKFLILEIDPVKYSEVIKMIQSQGHIIR